MTGQTFGLIATPTILRGQPAISRADGISTMSNKHLSREERERRKAQHAAKREAWINADLSRFTDADLDVLLDRFQVTDLCGVDVGYHKVPPSGETTTVRDGIVVPLSRLRDVLSVLRPDVAPSESWSQARSAA